MPPERLQQNVRSDISLRTLAHYSQSAPDFWEGTRDHDVSQNRACLLRHLQGPGPHDLLDLGCGPGRDLAAFAALGHRAVGLDGCAEFCEMARAHSGCEVWHQDFLAMDLPHRRFDGVFANASLFHVPTIELSRVLAELFRTLRAGGVLFASNPRGADTEGWSGDRYGAWHSLERWQAIVESAGFIELEHYYRPAGRPRSEQPWLASAWRRP